jgi:hypothetical protein
MNANYSVVLVGLALQALGNAWGAETAKTAAPLPPREVNLPDGVERLVYYGGLPQFSPDGKKIVFVEKAFGQAYEMELASRTIRNLTAAFPHVGFLRVAYLSSGDYLLVGPRRFTDEKTARYKETELWVLKKDLRSPRDREYHRLAHGTARRIHGALGQLDYIDRDRRSIRGARIHCRSSYDTQGRRHRL